MSKHEEDTFVPLELRTRATSELQDEVSEELEKPDPQDDKARAAIRKATEDK